jgi:hypothetical protein
VVSDVQAELYVADTDQAYDIQRHLKYDAFHLGRVA